MSSINKVMLVGRVGFNPVIKVSAGGVKHGSLSLATNESYKDKTGQKKEVTEWHFLKFFGSLSEIFERYVKKGHRIIVEGSIHYSEYEKDGQTVRSTEIIVKNLTLLEKPTQQEIDSMPSTEEEYAPQKGPHYDFDDDVAF